MPIPELPNTKPVPLPEVSVMPSFPDADDVDEAVDVTKRKRCLRVNVGVLLRALEHMC